MKTIEPYYQDESVTLYCADCRDVLPHLPMVDLVLTDPPYGIGDKMQGGTWGAKEKYADFRGWDKAPSQELITAIISKGRDAIVWGGNYFCLPISRCWLSWSKNNGLRTMSDIELAWTSLDSPAKELRLAREMHHSEHPTEKPVKLFEWCLGFAPEAKIILDPFAGSGTTGVAAKALGRKAILIEREEKYCEIIVKRLAQDYLSL